MKLVFAHDHIFYKYNDEFYSTGGLSKNMLERYTNVFEEVIVLSRQKNITVYDDKLTLASTERVKFVEVPNFKKADSIYKVFKAKSRIEEIVKESDKLIARIPSSIGTLAINAAKKHGKNYLVEVVACPWDALWNYSLKGKIVAPFSYFNMLKLVRNAPFAIYVTNEFLQKRYPNRGHSTNCSNVSLTTFNKNDIDKRIKKIGKMNDEKKIILGTVGAVNVKHKGQQYVIESLGKLKEEGNTNFEYQLVGGGDPTYLKMLAKKHKVAEDVKFIGTLPHSGVFKWLEEIDIYIQPSKQEGLPRALIEAMSRGLPSIGAKTAGIPELLEREYIFSNSQSNSSEICSLLKRFSKEDMIKQAEINYKKSKLYDKEVIEQRRNQFFKMFKEYEG
jgi:glycosyltransferase involved in cell wall biosynthesis